MVISVAMLMAHVQMGVMLDGWENIVSQVYVRLE